MMRLPYFHYHAPRTVREAADLLAASPGDTMLIAGGTDLLPNMKRRHQVPATLVGLRQIAELKGITTGDPSTLREPQGRPEQSRGTTTPRVEPSLSSGDGLTIGAGTTLADLVRDARVHDSYRGLWQAAVQVATPQLRNMGTIGGNLCLDTRCNYYDQSYEWRKAIDFCMKKDGETCWVATSSPKCLAVSSTDTAPALLALGAAVTLVSAGETRQIAVSDLYRNDGIHYLTRRKTEILASIHLPRLDGWRSTYWKLRRRGAFDFPVLSVAAALELAPDGPDGPGRHGRPGEIVKTARIVLGSVASMPIEAPAAAASLIGHPLTDEAIARAADLAARPARPMDNTDFALIWRKRVTRDFVTYALRELRGDDVRELRRRIARQELILIR